MHPQERLSQISYCAQLFSIMAAKRVQILHDLPYDVPEPIAIGLQYRAGI
jgi:hypothetical protein